MAKTKKRLNWRSIAHNVLGEGLRFPDVQKNHPLMQELVELIFFNAIPEELQQAVSDYVTAGNQIPMRTAYKIAKKGQPDMEELTEFLFTGLMTDVDYKDYMDMLEQKPSINARDYYNEFCFYNEKDPGVKKLAAMFEAVLDSDDTEEEYIPYISRQEFNKMRHDLDWVQKNLKSLEKSKKVWPKELGRRSR